MPAGCFWTARAGDSAARSTSKPSTHGTCRDAMDGSVAAERQRTSPRPPAITILLSQLEMAGPTPTRSDAGLLAAPGKGLEPGTLPLRAYSARFALHEQDDVVIQPFPHPVDRDSMHGGREPGQDKAARSSPPAHPSAHCRQSRVPDLRPQRCGGSARPLMTGSRCMRGEHDSFGQWVAQRSEERAPATQSSLAAGRPARLWRLGLSRPVCA